MVSKFYNCVTSISDGGAKARKNDEIVDWIDQYVKDVQTGVKLTKLIFPGTGVYIIMHLHT